MIIIGITGTLGSGKGEVVSYLKNKGFVHFSARSFLDEGLRKNNTPINRETMTDFADSLRKKYSPGYVIESLYARAKAQGQNAIIESVRALGEVDFLKKQAEEDPAVQFFLIAVDADSTLRFERITKRKSALDNVSFEKFIAGEEREMRSTDPTKGNISECIRRADFVVRNDGTLDELYRKVDVFLPKILKK